MEYETNTIIETVEETEETTTETVTEETTEETTEATEEEITELATEIEIETSIETECATSDSEIMETVSESGATFGTEFEQTDDGGGISNTSDVLYGIDTTTLEGLLIEQNEFIQQQTTVIDNGFCMLAVIILGIWVIKSVKSSVQKATRKEVPYKREGKK